MGHQEDLMLIATSAIFMFPINIIGLCYVYFRIISHFLEHGSLPPNLKLPFYVAVIDTFICATFGIELIHILITEKIWEENVCFWIGLSTSYFIIANFVLISTSALNTYLRVRFRKRIDLGRFEWKLLVPTFVVPAIVCTAYSVMDAFGSDRFICFIRPDKPIQASAIGIVVFLSVIQIAFCYISVVIILYKTIRASDEGSFPSETTNTSLSLRERQVIWKVSMYILACLIQYVPGCPYPISYLFTTNKPVPIYIIAVLTIQTGGMVNAITLLVNEGFREKAESGANSKELLESRSFGNHNTYSINRNVYGYNGQQYSFSDPGGSISNHSTSGDISNPQSWNTIMAARSAPVGISDSYTWEISSRTHMVNGRGGGDYDMQSFK